MCYCYYNIYDEIPGITITLFSFVFYVPLTIHLKYAIHDFIRMANNRRRKKRIMHNAFHSMCTMRNK